MKRFLLFLMMTAMLPLSSFQLNAAKHGVQLGVRYDDPHNNQPGGAKTPVLIPTISIDDYTLYFETPCDGCLLNVVDASNTVVYSVVIPVGTTSLVLPSYLSGTYELQIIQGNYCFYGDITL